MEEAENQRRDASSFCTKRKRSSFSPSPRLYRRTGARTSAADVILQLHFLLHFASGGAAAAAAANTAPFIAVQGRSVDRLQLSE